MFIIYLISLALVWWIMICKLDVGAGLTCMAMMFVSSWACIGGTRIELFARIASCLCAFFWTGMLILVEQLDTTFGGWLLMGTLLSIAFNALVSAHTYQVPMNRDGC